MASPDAPPVDILIDGSQVGTAISFMNVVAYLPVDTRQHRVEALTVSNSTAIFQQTISVTAAADETLVIAGPASKTQGILLTDGVTTITAGDGGVRVVNAASTIPQADVYIVSAGSGIAGATPVATDVTFAQVIGYQAEAIGNYQVLLTAPGTSNVYLNTGGLALTQTQYQTVIATSDTTGGFNYIVLTDQ
jgi:hypothetical protein